MLAATKVKMSGGEKKVNRSTYNISSIKRVAGSFTLQSGKTTAKKFTKKCAALVKLFFLLMRPIVAVRVKGKMVKGMGMGTGNARYEMWAVRDPLPPFAFPTRLCDSSIDQFRYI